MKKIVTPLPDFDTAAESARSVKRPWVSEEAYADFAALSESIGAGWSKRNKRVMR